MKKLFLASLFLFFASISIAEAIDRYVDNATTGGCSNGSTNYRLAQRDCATGGSNLVYVSLQAAITAQAAGDHIFIRGGGATYRDGPNNTYGNGEYRGKQGLSAGSRTIYEGYQSEFPHISGFDSGVDTINGTDQMQHVLLKNLVLDGENRINSFCGGNWYLVRLENVEMVGCGGGAVGGVAFSEFINVNMHHSGFRFEGSNFPLGGWNHAFYSQGVAVGNTAFYGGNLLDGGEYHHNAGYGIHDLTNCCAGPGQTVAPSIYRNLRTHHNGLGGAIVQVGSAATFYNVLAHDNGLGRNLCYLGTCSGYDPGNGVGIYLAGHTYNSTTYNNSAGGINTSQGGPTDAGFVVSNSIALDGIFTNLGTVSSSVTSGTATIYFVDPVNGDFHLNDNITTRDNAIGQGSDLSSTAGFNYDFGDGTGSPSGTTRTVPWDRGAYKFGTTPPTDTQAPVLAITSPFDGAYTTATSIAFGGTATDNIGVTSVTYVCTSGSGTATFSPSTWSRTQSLNLGANTCTFTANDLAGNTGPTAIGSITITRLAAPPPGLVWASALDSGSGTTAVDASSFAHNGTLGAGASWSGSGSGKYNNSITLTGAADSYISITNASQLGLVDNWTLSIWVNPTTVTANWRALIVKNYSVFLYAMSPILCSGGPIGGFFEDPQLSTVCTSTNLTPNVWTHVAFTYNGSTLTLFINGVSVATTTIVGGVNTTTGPLYIGASGFGGEGFIGKIDDPRVYNRALSQPEIQTDMNTPIMPPPNTVTIKLNVSSWKFGPGVTAKFGLQ